MRWDSANEVWIGSEYSELSNDRAAVTRLGDGRILFVGLVYAEETSSLVYEPTTNTWTRVADAETSWQAVIAMPPGNALGMGSNDANFIGSAEVFDIATDTWRPASPPPVSLREPKLGVLPDGRVAAVGGIDPNASINAQAQATTSFYDPDSDTWTVGSEMGTPRQRHTVTPLGSGALLVAGGRDEQMAELASAELLAAGIPLGDPCTGPGECEEGFCIAEVCTPPPNIGDACDDHSQCPDGENCWDGVCCNKECGGECDACTADRKGTGDDGICGPALECIEGGATCGDDGHTLVGEDGDDVDCSPYRCEGAACLVRCDSAADCTEGNRCTSDGECEAESAAPESGDAGGCGCLAVGSRPCPLAHRAALLLILVLLAARKKTLT